MAQIIIQNLSEKIIKVTGQSQTLLKVIQQEGIDWMHACGAKGRCTTCKFIVLEGGNNLSLPSENENRYRGLGALAESERLACQVNINGDVRIAVPEECKLPHVKYSA
jgi:ferredoxin, 2Fe-2S